MSNIQAEIKVQLKHIDGLADTQRVLLLNCLEEFSDINHVDAQRVLLDNIGMLLSFQENLKYLKDYLKEI